VSAAEPPLDRATRGGIIGPVSEPSGYSGSPIPGSGPSDNGRHVNSDPPNASYWPEWTGAPERQPGRPFRNCSCG